MKKFTIAFALLVTLAACSTEEAPQTGPVSRVLPPKFMLDVQSINLADRSGIQPANSPYNSNHFSPTISEAIKQWASDRLQANGQTGQAVIIVKDASLVAQPLATKDGMDGWFTRQQSVKYIGRADVSIEANGRQGFAVTDASATRAVTLPENPTAVEKQDAYYTLLNGLMKDLGQNLESGIQSHMASFILANPASNGIITPISMAKPAAPSVVVPTGPQPQAPIFGRTAVPTVPSLASAPSSFQQDASTDNGVVQTTTLSGSNGQ